MKQLSKIALVLALSFLAQGPLFAGTADPGPNVGLGTIVAQLDQVWTNGHRTGVDALTKDQAKVLIPLLLQWQNRSLADQARARGLWDQVQAVLTPHQKAEGFSPRLTDKGQPPVRVALGRLLLKLEKI